MGKYNLGVTDIRKITAVLVEKGYADFSDFALTSLRRRFELVLTRHNLPGADELITRIYSDDSFIDSLVDELSVETTEMFRDPSLWRLLRDKFLPLIFAGEEKVKILLPDASSPEDLLSLMILLAESGLKEKVAVSVTSLSLQNLHKIRNGISDSNKMEINEANYKKFQGTGNLCDYWVKEDEGFTWKNDLTSEVEFSVHKSHLQDIPQNLNLILFRDKMIYFNAVLGNKVLEKMYNNIRLGGYLVIGAGESLAGGMIDRNFIQADPNEKIYRKIR